MSPSCQCGQSRRVNILVFVWQTWYLKCNKNNSDDYKIINANYALLTLLHNILIRMQMSVALLCDHSQLAAGHSLTTQLLPTTTTTSTFWLFSWIIFCFIVLLHVKWQQKTTTKIISFRRDHGTALVFGWAKTYGHDWWASDGEIASCQHCNFCLFITFSFFFSSFLSSFKYYFLFESHDLGRNCAVRSIRNQQKKTFSFLYYSGRARVLAKASLFDRAVAQYFRWIALVTVKFKQI